MTVCRLNKLQPAKSPRAPSFAWIAERTAEAVIYLNYPGPGGPLPCAAGSAGRIATLSRVVLIAALLHGQGREVAQEAQGAPRGNAANPPPQPAPASAGADRDPPSGADTVSDGQARAGTKRSEHSAAAQPAAGTPPEPAGKRVRRRSATRRTGTAPPCG